MRRFAIAIALLLGTAGPVAAQTYVLLHGNYCGFRNKLDPDGISLPPVDTLDEICMRHDQCYDELGNANCTCDLALMSEVDERVWANGLSTRLARAVFYGIAAKPCTDRFGQLGKIELALSSDL